MFGLLMAGTIHSVAAGKEMSESGGSVKMAEELSRWLTDGEFLANDRSQGSFLDFRC